MMINIASSSGHAAYNVKQFVLDTEADIPNLPKNVATGSTAFVIDNSVTYMINSLGEWTKVAISGGGLPGKDVIYDGGEA